jgi:hypothetical protein
MKHHFLLVALSCALTSCGGGSGSSGNEDDKPVLSPPNVPTPQPEAGYSPEVTGISDITLLDAYGAPIPNANVTISPLSSVANASVRALSSPVVSVTDVNGNFVTNDLEPGTYSINVSIGSVSVTFTLIVGEANAGESASVIAPVSISEDAGGGVIAVDLSENGLFVSLSGTVFDVEGPVAGAQLSISGGEETNGAVTTGFSDTDGNYTLTFNVAAAKLASISEGSIRVYADGYVPLLLTVSEELEIDGSSAFSGLNFELTAREDDVTVYYSEDFEQSSSSSCGSWTEYVLQSSDYFDVTAAPEGASFEAAAAEVAEATEPEDTLWNPHTAGKGIVNQAYLDGLVLMAPDDSSAGKVVDPESNVACWYGDDTTGTATTGNFMDEAREGQEGSLNGGDSITYNAGAIVSPEIDLTNIDGLVSLSFDTWWEIESVNPNENGFDLMSVEYDLGEGEGWQTLIRLNPLTDPVTDAESTSTVAPAAASEEESEETVSSRASLPYSNTGFNRAPRWISHEPVSLDALKGNYVTLRFVFRTQDNLYNGFRGWMVDNIRITDEAGSFPAADIPFLPGPPVIDNEASEPEEFVLVTEYTPSTLSLSEGSTRTFTADVSWSGGDQAVGSVKLQVFRNESLIDETTVEADAFTGKSAEASVEAYVGGSGSSVRLILTVYDDEGEVIHSEQKAYSVMAV